MTVRMHPVEFYCMHKLFSLTAHAKPSHNKLSQNATSDKLEEMLFWERTYLAYLSKPATWKPFPVGWSSVDFWKETAEISAHCAAPNMNVTLRMRQMKRDSAPSAVCSIQLNNYEADKAPSADFSIHYYHTGDSCSLSLAYINCEIQPSVD